ncbi:MAG: CRISPR-associated protein Cas4 [Synergistaceae bacterium]|jgi:CRISPR-associated exonuclease Cas4|nr:CRISPR-associated protein Cas4 [Synergistaceae bacterium]
MYSDDDLLAISGLQHMAFCERQWALIHIEREWDDNVLTIEGRHLHEFVHEQGSGSRSGALMIRGLRLRSLEIGLYGVADLVEFHPSDDGAEVEGHPGRWRPYPVEYKRGVKRYDRADEIQVCAQALCLEEMFGATVRFGAVYHGQPRRRTETEISDSLRNEMKSLCARARELLDVGGRARPNVGRHCKNCSLVVQCMPGVISRDGSAEYMSRIIADISASPECERPG